MQPLQPQLRDLIEQMRRCNILYGEAVREFKETFIVVALRDNKGNQSRTARALGMHRNTLTRHVAELGIREATRRRRPPEKAAAA
jgi:Fis family transcriptional regulator, factor for inversion stimulation protein